MNRLLALLQKTSSSRIGVETLAVELEKSGADDIESVLDECSSRELELLMLAAYKIGRPFDVAQVSRAFPDLSDRFLVRAVRTTRGDHLKVLMDGVESGRLARDRGALSLYLCVHLLGEQEPPRRLIGLLRTLSRQDLPEIPGILVGAAADKLGDGHLSQVSAKWIALSRSRDGEGLIRFLSRDLAGDPLDSLSPIPSRAIRGFTLRRSMDKLGRNEPCHCGSGKKYKKCCLAEDEERLMEPSPLTQRELRDLPLREQARLDFNQVLRPTLVEMMRSFSAHQMWSDAERALEALDKHEDFDQRHRHDYVEDLIRSGQFERADRQLARLRELDFPIRPNLELELEIAKEPPGCLLARLNEMALEGLQDEEGDHLISLACMLLHQVPGLGIPFSRGVLSAARSTDSTTLTDLVEETRDRLDLPPGDRALEIFECLLERKLERAREHALHQGYEKLAMEAQELRERLARSSQRVAEFSRQLAEKERELERRLSELARTLSREERPDPEVSRLREKVRQLKSLIKTGNQERRELRENVKELSASRPAPPLEAPGEAAEEQESEPDDNLTLWPTLLPRFSNQAKSDFRQVEASISRRAMARLGEICTGEPGARSQVKKLLLRPTWRSARVGRAHRLIFEPKVEVGVLEVLALINRRDLERFLKSRLMVSEKPSLTVRERL